MSTVTPVYNLRRCLSLSVHIVVPLIREEDIICFLYTLQSSAYCPKAAVTEVLGWAHNTLCKLSALEIIAPTPQLEVPVSTGMESVLFLQI